MEPKFAYAWLHAHFAFYLIFSKMLLWNSLTSILAWRCSTSSSSKTNLLKPLTGLGPLGQKITSIADHGPLSKSKVIFG